MCYRISDMGLCKIERGHTYSLKEFREAQFSQLNEVAGRLMEFRDLVKEVTFASILGINCLPSQAPSLWALPYSVFSNKVSKLVLLK